MKEQNTNIDYEVIGLIITLFITIGILNFSLGQTKKELNATKNVVYYISDKLDIAHSIIESLNKEQRIMQNEINEMKKVQRITKELR